MRIEERFVITAPIETVWAFILDPARIAPCIPGCESVQAISPSSYRSTIAIALGPIKARFNVIVELTEQLPPQRLVCMTKSEEGSRASTVSAQSEIVLTAINDKETAIGCTSEVSIVGRLGRFGLGIMKKRASQMAVEFARVMQERVQANG